MLFRALESFMAPICSVPIRNRANQSLRFALPDLESKPMMPGRIIVRSEKKPPLPHVVIPQTLTQPPILTESNLLPPQRRCSPSSLALI